MNRQGDLEAVLAAPTGSGERSVGALLLGGWSAPWHMDITAAL
jgi:hypothetical protein